ncbi:MAG: polymer-forming cytoskeletal protein [Lachnospiraceae bacterium]|nr:polymer-forming cytoskeletal protein [Lachnospiraceae bacterium]
MDLNISGSGQIMPGEYDTIRVSGSGRLEGTVRCQNLFTSGSVGGNSVECKNDINTSGSCNFSGDISTGNLIVSGGSSFGGNVEARDKIAVSGGSSFKRDVKCKQLRLSGGSKIGGDVEAELVKIRGAVDCVGLMNAEEIDIEYERGMEIGSIGGSKIVIYKRHGEVKKKKFRLPLFSSLIKKSTVDTVVVKNSIEGDEIALEGVVCPRVSGRVVAIGADCEIELVQYSEQVEVSPEAKVGRTERI